MNTKLKMKMNSTLDSYIVYVGFNNNRLLFYQTSYQYLSQQDNVVDATVI